MEVVWARLADRDLAGIYGYLEPRSIQAARRLLRRVFKAIDTLSEMPGVGVAVDLGGTTQYRQHVVEHYKIFYYIEKNRMVIVRLWDTRQDPSKFFVTPPDP